MYIVPADLIHSDFGSYTQISVCPDMLTTHMMIFDASTPLSVFAREDMLDKIEVPGSAKGTIVNTMMHTSAPPMGGPYPGQTGFIGKMNPGMMPGANAPQPRPEPDKPTEPKKEGPNFCP
ncbi:MAG: hypothetical protein J6X19_05855, partial [Clostridia bacterium]|nr:hypothetical protein [Clostridia bacterium]